MDSTHNNQHQAWRMIRTLVVTWVALFYIIGLVFFPFIAINYMDGTQVSKIIHYGIDRLGIPAFIMTYMVAFSVLHIVFAVLARHFKAGRLSPSH